MRFEGAPKPHRVGARVAGLGGVGPRGCPGSFRSYEYMQEFKLPDLGEGMHEAEITRWLVKPGDTIKLDQPMVEVETDKALVEIPSPVSGRISDIRVLAGQVAKVGEVLVVFETPDDRSSTNDSGSFKSVTTNPATQTASASSSSISTAEASPPPKKRVLAAPAVRKLAFELGIDLEQVTTSNPNGRVSIEDVRSYAEQDRASSKLPASLVPVGHEEE